MTAGRKIPLVAAAALVAIVAGWYLALWKPAGHQLAAANQALDSARNDHLAAVLQYTSLRHAEGRLGAAEVNAGQLASAAPRSAQIDRLVDDLSLVAKAAGVNLMSEATTQPGAAAGASPASSSSSSSSSSGATPAGGLQELSVTVGVSGTEAQVLAFVSDLQSAPRLIKVGSLTLGTSGGNAGTTPSTDPSGPAVTTTQITATAYVDATPLPKSPSVPRS